MFCVIKKENLIEKMITRIEFWKHYNSESESSLLEANLQSSQPEYLFKKLTEMSPLLLYVMWRLDTFCFVDVGLKV